MKSATYKSLELLLMFSMNYKGSLAAVAIAALLTACSQGTTATSSLPNAPAGSVNSSQGKAIAPLAKRMLALKRGGPVILAHVGIAGLFAPVHPEVGTTLYDSILLYGPHSLPGDNLSSEGFECCQVDEFGDALNLTQSDSVTKVQVVMQSWACESGFWFADNCSTTSGAKFAEPITLSIYKVAYTTTSSGTRPEPGIKILQATKTFNINYRPSANRRCIGTAYSAGGFIGKPDGYCDEGVSQIISWSVSRPITTLPTQVIVTVAYNTSTSGYNPYGTGTSCYSGPGGCGYDGLNVAADGNGGPTGSPIDANGVQVYYTSQGDYTSGGCTGYNSRYTLQDSYPCWTGYHPEISVTGT
jgi:hypothetical protein